MFKKEAEENGFGIGCTVSPTIAWQKGAEFGYNKAKEWHYVKDGEHPQLVDLPDGSNYNPLVLVFWWSFDSDDKKSKVYALDRWCTELKKWDEHNRRGIIAWQPLPEPPEEVYGNGK